MVEHFQSADMMLSSRMFAFEQWLRPLVNRRLWSIWSRNWKNRIGFKIRNRMCLRLTKLTALLWFQMMYAGGSGEFSMMHVRFIVDPLSINTSGAPTISVVGSEKWNGNRELLLFVPSRSRKCVNWINKLSSRGFPSIRITCYRCKVLDNRKFDNLFIEFLAEIAICFAADNVRKRMQRMQCLASTRCFFLLSIWSHHQTTESMPHLGLCQSVANVFSNERMQGVRRSRRIRIKNKRIHQLTTLLMLTGIGHIIASVLF